MALDTKFDPKELEISRTVPFAFGDPIKLFTTPITFKENMMRLYEGKTPMWTPFAFGESTMYMVSVDPENQARSPEGGIDGYGVEWTFVPSAGGAMVKPGDPKILDINHWEDYVTIPDPDTWDWEKAKAELDAIRTDDMATIIAVPGCLFERLIACMDFMYAAMALIDDEQKEGVHRFLRAVTEVHKKFYKNVKKYLNPEIVNWNDDWGSQRAEFFSVETAREMLFPYVKEVGDLVHELGFYFDLHSCGFVEGFVPMFIEEGFNSWGGQPMNDKAKLKEQYGDKMIFTIHVELPMDATEEEMDKAVEEFITGPGADNRCLVSCMGPAALREKIYAASRKNYDRLLAEGKVIG